MEEFIRVWNSSKNALEASQRLGLTYSTTTTRASLLRKKGHDLVKFPSGFAGIDKELAKKAQSRGGKASAETRRREKEELERYRNEQTRRI